MAFKMNYSKGGFPFKKTEGDSPMDFNKDYQKNRRIKRAKRITRKHVKNTTSDSPDFDESKFERSEKRMIKADKLLQKAGYGLGEREEALGAGGYEAAMNWAKKNKKKKKKKESIITDDYAEMNPDHK
tara:strand:- start:268 stop:651 length:384 start_codon:yes stop_codon:yes gene_type:complete